MLDSQIGSARAPPAISAVQFLSFEVLTTADGKLGVSFTATFVDEERLEFINRDLECIQASSLDEALAVIRREIVETFMLGIADGGH